MSRNFQMASKQRCTMGVERIKQMSRMFVYNFSNGQIWLPFAFSQFDLLWQRAISKEQWECLRFTFFQHSFDINCCDMVWDMNNGDGCLFLSSNGWNVLCIIYYSSYYITYICFAFEHSNTTVRGNKEVCVYLWVALYCMDTLFRMASHFNVIGMVILSSVRECTRFINIKKVLSCQQSDAPS